MLALCHTVVLEREDDGSISYNADSPDEVALVKGGASCGYHFAERKGKRVTVRLDGGRATSGEARIYEVLNVVAFNSTRKRMSVVVRRVDNGDARIWLLCKGADNVIIDRLASR